MGHNLMIICGVVKSAEMILYISVVLYNYTITVDSTEREREGKIIKN